MKERPIDRRNLQICLVASLIALFLSFNTLAQVRARPDKDSSNILKIVKTTPDPKIKIEPVTGFPDKSSLVTNRAKTLRAFILCLPAVQKGASCSSRVFITNKASGKTFMIRGEDAYAEGARPIDELKWLDNDRLSYERWMSPHYGHRYVISVRLKKQVAAYAVSDTGR